MMQENKKVEQAFELQDLLTTLQDLALAFNVGCVLTDEKGTMLQDYINAPAYIKRYRSQSINQAIILEGIAEAKPLVKGNEEAGVRLFTSPMGLSFLIVELELRKNGLHKVIVGPLRVDAYYFTENTYKEIADNHGWNFEEYLDTLRSLPYFTMVTLEHLSNVIRQLLQQFVQTSNPKALSQRIQKIEDRIAWFFHHIPDGMILFNRTNGKIIDANAASQRMLGFERTDFLEKSIEDFYLNANVVWNTDYILNLLAQHEIEKIDIRWKHANGSEVFAETYFTWLSPTEPDIMIAILKDITFRIEMDKQQEEEKKSLVQIVEERTRELLELNIKLRSYNNLLQAKNQKIREANLIKDVFLANISHELRTPLNSVIGFAQLLGMKVKGDDEKDKVHRILSSAEHLLSLINELLELSEMASGRFAIEKSSIKLTPLIGDSLRLLEVPIRHKALKVFQEIDPLVETVISDRFRLKQILFNLLSNAVKYSNPQGTIYVRCKPDESEGQVVFEIQDFGLGINKEDHERIFTEFYQAEPTMTRDQEGLGIGLAITRKLVELLGGYIWVHSVPGEGSTFYFTLPLDSEKLSINRIAEETPGSYIRNEKIEVKKQSRILVVEDSPSNLHLMEEILSEMGNIQILTAQNGDETLICANERPLNLILIDLRLEQEDGLEIVRTLRSNPKTKYIPIIAISAYITPGIDQQAMDAGCSHFIPKPIKDLNEFYEIIQSYINE